MKYSGNEPYQSPDDTLDDEALVGAVLPLLPLLGRRLYAGLTRRGQVAGLTVAQTKAVLHLAADGPLAIGDIAGRLGVSMPAASELVDRLAERGFVRREDDPADRRRVLVAATPEAERIGADLADLRRAQVARALALLPPEERAAFPRALAALVVALDDGTDPRGPSPVADPGPSRSRS